MKPVCVLQIMLILLLTCKLVNSQSLNVDSLKKEQVKYEYETGSCDSSVLIKRTDSNLIILSFFEVFDDTVVMYVNGKEVMKQNIIKSNNPSTSSGYSGYDVGIVLNDTTDKKIYFKLVNQKKYVSIVLDKSYPLCTIQRYDDIWYVNFRKKRMIIK